MVERHWTAIARQDSANDYIAYLQSNTLLKLKSIIGFVSLRILQRQVKDGVEFLVISEWKTIAAIKNFAGENVTAAVVPEIVQEMMLNYDTSVRHYEVIDNTSISRSKG